MRKDLLCLYLKSANLVEVGQIGWLKQEKMVAQKSAVNP